MNLFVIGGRKMIVKVMKIKASNCFSKVIGVGDKMAVQQKIHSGYLIDSKKQFTWSYKL